MSLVVGMLLVVPGGSAALAQRMVGKGSLPGASGTGGTAGDAYIVPCVRAGGSPAVFEIRVTGGTLNGERFRVTSVDPEPICRDDPLVPTPPAGFDTAEGVADVTASPPSAFVRLGFVFVDGGPGGANDSAALILVRGPRPGPGDIRSFGAAPPGPFPGSSQPTGLNTALAE